jgi:sodium transport system permease protein
MPAICEEMLFRGFIFTSFKNKKNVNMAIIGSAILFGFMHIDFIRIIPTTILGVILAYAVYKTGSIFVAMLIHFINNGLVVVMMHYPKNNIANVVEYVNIYSPNFDIGRFVILIVLSAILLVIGSLLLKNNVKDDKEKIVNTY